MGTQRMMTVEPMRGRTGRNVPNQFIIRTNRAFYFKSYNSIIAKVESATGQVFLGNDWAYSTTTGKYRNEFLGEDKKETERKIKSGEYIRMDLDKEGLV